MPEIAKLQEQVHTLFENDSRHDREMAELRKDVADCNQILLNEIKELRKEMASRLPLWATMIIALLTAIVGWSLR